MTRPLLQVVQQVVRATHAWPGPRHLYRAIYHHAANAVGRLAETNGSIAAIYARNSYALGTWTPGISDIDLTVVWRHPSSADLAKFYDQSDRLRRRFPMIGEVEMIEERHVRAWSSRGWPAFQSASWRKLGGNDELDLYYLSDERVDLVREATAIYRYNLSPLFTARHTGWAFARFAAKLFRLFDKPVPPAETDAEMMAACLRELSNQVAALPRADDADAVRRNHLVGEPRPAAYHPSPLQPPDPSCIGVVGRGDDRFAQYVVVSPGVTSISPGNSRQVTMDPAVFRFYLCFVDPLEYVALAGERTVFFGADPLVDMLPISLAALRDSVRYCAGQMFTCPYRHELVRASRAEFWPLLYCWLLRTLRFLEDGQMTFDDDVMREYFGNRHVDTVPNQRRDLLLGICDDLVPHLLVSETHSSPAATPQRI